MTSAELVGSLLRAEVDVRDLPGLTGAARLAARAVGTVHLDVALAGYRDGVAHLAVEAHARSVPAHRLAALFTGPLDAAVARTLTDRGLPPGLTTVGESGGVLTVAVRVQDALDAAPLPPFLRGAVVDDLALPAAFDDISRAHHIVLHGEGRGAFLQEYLAAPGLTAEH